MSYSFSVKGATKALAAEAVAKGLAAVVASQPVHKQDESQAFGAAELAMEALPDDPSKDISISLSGSLSWSGNSDDGAWSDNPAKENITACSISVSVSLVPRS